MINAYFIRTLIALVKPRFDSPRNDMEAPSWLQMPKERCLYFHWLKRPWVHRLLQPLLRRTMSDWKVVTVAGPYTLKSLDESECSDGDTTLTYTTALYYNDKRMLKKSTETHNAWAAPSGRIIASNSKKMKVVSR